MPGSDHCSSPKSTGESACFANADLEFGRARLVNQETKGCITFLQPGEGKKKEKKPYFNNIELWENTGSAKPM